MFAESGRQLNQEFAEVLTDQLGRRPKLLVAKPGLDGHSNGAEQIAVHARDSGFEAVYAGIRLTPQQVVSSAVQEGVHIVGLSILSGSHDTLVGDILQGLQEEDYEVPVVLGGIIPAKDHDRLTEMGVSRIYTPRDYKVTSVVHDMLELVRVHNDIPELLGEFAARLEYAGPRFADQ